MKTQDVLASMRGKNIHIIGAAGTEGATVVDFLVGGGVTTLTAHEFRRREDFTREFTRTHQWLPPGEREAAAQRLLSYPITFYWAEEYLKGIEQAQVIVVPQAWFRYPANAPLRRLKDRGVAFTSMTQLFFEVSPCPIIGVTGTNGKFTVAYLIHQMLARSGLRAFFSGNDRSHVPMLYYAGQLVPQDKLVLELSNRQLIDLPYSPQLAVITNIAAHHLDDHGSFAAYIEVKRTILRHQRDADVAVLNADNPYTAAMASACPHPYLFSRHRVLRDGAYVDGETIVITRGRLEQTIPLRALPLPSAPAVENALAACLAASLAGASAAAMAEVLSEFRGLPYRFRLVAEIGGVRYIEDSLATNPAAAAAAIGSMDRPFVLIAGGARPGASAADFGPMRAALQGAPVKAVLLIGATAPQLQQALTGLPVVAAGTLERAVAEAQRLARSGDAVLLSPGCESFDQFTDYRERGDRFVALVRTLAADGAPAAPPA
jgi:UDP-N-acetylmuramoylalanine--D-glutamate ligase